MQENIYTRKWFDNKVSNLRSVKSVKSKTFWEPPFQSLPNLARFIHFLKMASASVQHCSFEEVNVAKTWEMSLSVPTILSHGFPIQRYKVLRQTCATNAHLHNLELVKSLKGLGKCVCYIEVSFFRNSFFIILLLLGWRKSFVVPRTSLYRGSLYRSSIVHMTTPPPSPSHLHHFEHLYPQFTLSINIGAFVSWGRGGGRINQRSHLYSDLYLSS